MKFEVVVDDPGAEIIARPDDQVDIVHRVVGNVRGAPPRGAAGGIVRRPHLPELDLRTDQLSGDRDTTARGTVPGLRNPSKSRIEKPSNLGRRAG